MLSMRPYAAICSAVLLSFLAAGIHGQPYSSGVGILTSDVSPNPVEPGADLTVNVKLVNQGDFEANIGRLEILAQRPFIFKSSQLSLENIRICRGCSYTRTLYFTMASDAVSGTYAFTLLAKSDSFSVPHTVEVKVVGRPNLGVEVLEGGRIDSIAPNGRFNVTLAVKNRGSGIAKEIVLSSSSADFIPIGSGSFFLDSLMPGSIRLLTVDFAASQRLEANSYTIPLSVAYKDEVGNIMASNSSIGVKVINAGELDIQSVKIAGPSGETEIYEGQPFFVVVRVENIGYGDATSITGEMGCPFGSGRKGFLGKLEREEDAPMVFDMRAEKAGIFECTVNVGYRNDIGEMKLAEKIPVAIEKRPPEYSLIIMIVIIAVAVILYLSRMFKRGRRAKGSGL